MPFSYVEYSGTGAQTNFVVSPLYLQKSHIHAYVDDVEVTAFTWVNATTIQFTTAPASGTLNIELRRVTPSDVSQISYSDGNVLFATDLNVGVLQSLFIAQEYREQADDQFPAGHAIDSHTDASPGTSVAKGTLRIYDEFSKWNAITAPATGGLLIGDTVDGNGARWLAKGTDGYTLEVEDAVSGKLSWKQGLRKLVTTAGDMLYATASGVMARLALGTAGYVLTARAGGPVWEFSPWTTGDVKLTYKNTAVADPGWILMDDKSIGSATSGATGRANADTADLYALLWTNIADQWAPVVGGRGISPVIDFSDNKPMRLPKTLGRALAGYGTGTITESGVDAAVDLGANTLAVLTNTDQWVTGTSVIFTLASGTITGLTSGVTYWVIRDTSTTIKLASTLANAQNGTAIDLSAKSSPVWTLTFTDATREMGESIGSRTHAISSVEALAHTHTFDQATVGGGGASGTGGNTPAGVATSSTGGNVAMNIMNPTTYMNVLVKL